MNLIPTWPIRASRALITKPKFALGDVPTRIRKLGMIESVEELGAELQALRFCQAKILGQRRVRVVPAGPVEEAPVGVAELFELRSTEQPRSEADCTE